jgi:hypothetical protein
VVPVAGEAWRRALRCAVVAALEAELGREWLRLAGPLLRPESGPVPLEERLRTLAGSGEVPWLGMRGGRVVLRKVPEPLDRCLTLRDLAVLLGGEYVEEEGAVAVDIARLTELSRLRSQPPRLAEAVCAWLEA